VSLSLPLLQAFKGQFLIFNYQEIGAMTDIVKQSVEFILKEILFLLINSKGYHHS